MTEQKRSPKNRTASLRTVSGEGPAAAMRPGPLPVSERGGIHGRHSQLHRGQEYHQDVWTLQSRWKTTSQFDAERGELICILGPSGCGKTTPPSRRGRPSIVRIPGTITVDGRSFAHIPVSKRNIGIVFQSYALFPNLSAEQNIGYWPWRRDSATGRSVRERVEELLQLVGLQGMGKKYPRAALRRPASSGLPWARAPGGSSNAAPVG